MSQLLKDIYNTEFFARFTQSLQEVLPEWNAELFLRDIYAKGWADKELKQRMRHITTMLEAHLSDRSNLSNCSKQPTAKSFSAKVEFILKLIPVLKKNAFQSGHLEFLFLPDFIEIYGIDADYKVAIQALEEITKFVSCEFAVRPFIIKYPEKMLEQMLIWSKHKNPEVRRLASEGVRPRLPWGMAIPALKKDPKPLFPILQNLQNDASETVRRSVANNLNDISKDHAQQVIELAENWKGQTKETDALLKHACRTLLKQGNPEVLRLFGFVDAAKITEFKVLSPKVEIGAALEFSFQICTSKPNTKIRLEYGIYYQKANGSLARKVFKISEMLYAEKSSREIYKKHSFRVITTRKFHLGQHQVSVIVNGRESEKRDFVLEAQKT